MKIAQDRSEDDDDTSLVEQPFNGESNYGDITFIAEKSELQK